MKSVPACSRWPLQVRVDYEDVTITRLTKPRWYGAGRSFDRLKNLTRRFVHTEEWFCYCHFCYYLICVLKNENNKQTVEASKRRSLDECFFFLIGLSPILFALTVDSEELNIVRQVCINWGSLNYDGGKKAIALNWQNNNFARASRFFIHCLAVVALLQLRRDNAWFTVLSRKGTQDNNFLFLFLNFDDSPLEFNSKNWHLPTFDEWKRD